MIPIAILISYQEKNKSATIEHYVKFTVLSECCAVCLKESNITNKSTSQIKLFKFTVLLFANAPLL